MNKKLFIIGAAAFAVTGCANAIYDGRDPRSGLTAQNVPVVSQTNYAYDIAAPGGVLPANEAARLAAWFDGLGLTYGDTIYLDGPAADSARGDVAAIAGRYGLMVTPGAPVTPGAVPAGGLRVIVGRATASVPNCPNFNGPISPNPQNEQLPGYGCAVNGAMAQMIANPNDLVYGREGSGIADTRTSTRAVEAYRNNTPSGAGGAVTAVSPGG